MDPNQNPSGVMGLTQQQMVNSLQSLMSNIEGSYKNFQHQQTVSQSGMTLQKSDVLQQLYDLFQTQGVDPSNPQEVRNLLDKVQSNNPQTYQQIEQSLQSLLGSDQTPAPVQSNIDPSVAGNSISTTDDAPQTPQQTPLPSGIPTPVPQAAPSPVIEPQTSIPPSGIVSPNTSPTPPDAGGGSSPLVGANVSSAISQMINPPTGQPTA